MLENALQESISIQRAAYLDAQLATTGGASGGHLSLTAESAAAIYKGGTFDQSAQEDLSRVSKEATRLVKSVCSGWNSHMQASTDIIDTFSRAEESGGKVARQQMEKFLAHRLPISFEGKVPGSSRPVHAQMPVQE